MACEYSCSNSSTCTNPACDRYSGAWELCQRVLGKDRRAQSLQLASIRHAVKAMMQSFSVGVALLGIGARNVATNVLSTPQRCTVRLRTKQWDTMYCPAVVRTQMVSMAPAVVPSQGGRKESQVSQLLVKRSSFNQMVCQESEILGAHTCVAPNVLRQDAHTKSSQEHTCLPMT